MNLLYATAPKIFGPHRPKNLTWRPMFARLGLQPGYPLARPRIYPSRYRDGSRRNPVIISSWRCETCDRRGIAIKHNFIKLTLAMC